MSRNLFHLVDASPWPFVSSWAAFLFVIGLVCYMNSVFYGGLLLLLGFILILGVMFVWWSDVLSESVYQGNHTIIVQKGLKMGFSLFILSEVMLFFAFFWALFHSSLSPSILLGLKWPPVDLVTLSPVHMPLLNTVILIFSSMTVTTAHKYLLLGSYDSFKMDLLFTILLGFIFEVLQMFEYYSAAFNMTDGIYGSTFYTLTGLHGLHVFLGACFLLVIFFSVLDGTIVSSHHLGFEFSVWYWHFVDVVWIFLFMMIYLWGTW